MNTRSALKSDLQSWDYSLWSLESTAAIGAEFLALNDRSSAGRAGLALRGRRCAGGKEPGLPGRHIALDLLVDVLLRSQMVKLLQDDGRLAPVTCLQAAIVRLGKPAHSILELQVLHIGIDDGFAVEQSVQFGFCQKLHLKIPPWFPE